jgi:hypothetical protein
VVTSHPSGSTKPVPDLEKGSKPQPKANELVAPLASALAPAAMFLKPTGVVVSNLILEQRIPLGEGSGSDSEGPLPEIDTGDSSEDEDENMGDE